MSFMSFISTFPRETTCVDMYLCGVACKCWQRVALPVVCEKETIYRTAPLLGSVIPCMIYIRMMWEEERPVSKNRELPSGVSSSAPRAPCTVSRSTGGLHRTAPARAWGQNPCQAKEGRASAAENVCQGSGL